MEPLSTLLILLLISLYIQIGVFIFLEVRSPSKALGWLLILFLLPIIGLIFYIILRYGWNKTEPSSTYEHSETKMNQQVLLFFEGDPLFNHLFEQLQQAKHHIHIAFFIIRDDHVGERLKQILIQKAQSGCIVRLIYDGIGSISLSKKYVNDLKNAGVEAHNFLPFSFPWLKPSLNRRYHRKIVVIDGEIGYLGGFNIGKEYVGENPKLGYWRDAHFMIKGGSVSTLQKLFLADWYRVSKQSISGAEYTPHGIGDSNEDKLKAEIIWGGPESTFPFCLHRLIAFMYQARESIMIATPYLVPDDALLTVLKERSLAGIDITIVLPKKPDHKLVYYASHSYIEELLQAGIKIHLFEAGFMHSKMMIYDNDSLFIGTSNLDLRSFYLNYEVNAVIYDLETVKEAKQQFLHDIRLSQELTYETFQKRPWSKKLKEGFARLFGPLL